MKILLIVLGVISHALAYYLNYIKADPIYWATFCINGNIFLMTSIILFGISDNISKAVGFLAYTIENGLPNKEEDSRHED